MHRYPIAYLQPRWCVGGGSIREWLADPLSDPLRDATLAHSGALVRHSPVLGQRSLVWALLKGLRGQAPWW